MQSLAQILFRGRSNLKSFSERHLIFTALMNNNNTICQLKRTAKSDPQKAFTLFYKNYYGKLLRFAMTFFHNRTLAEDAVSEVLIRLLRKRNDLFFIENFEGYLYQYVKNEALNNIKLNRTKVGASIEESSHEILPDLMDPHQRLVEHELRYCVSTLIESLPPKRKMVYRLIKDEGMRYKDVAGIMDISERTVEVHLKIAVQDLRLAVSNHFNETAMGSFRSKQSKDCHVQDV